VKQLRAFARDTAPKLPWSQLMVGKTAIKDVPIFLDFQTAGKAAEDLAALMVADPIKGTADHVRLEALADIMEQYQKALKMVYSDEAIADGKHVDHLPIKVWGKAQRITAINSPRSRRGIYRHAKRLFRRVEREIGMHRARV